jgi:hypothetical protein
VCSVQRAVCCVQCAACSVLCAVCSVQCVVCSVHRANEGKTGGWLATCWQWHGKRRTRHKARQGTTRQRHGGRLLQRAWRDAVQTQRQGWGGRRMKMVVGVVVVVVMMMMVGTSRRLAELARCIMCCGGRVFLIKGSRSHVDGPSRMAWQLALMNKLTGPGPRSRRHAETPAFQGHPPQLAGRKGAHCHGLCAY